MHASISQREQQRAELAELAAQFEAENGPIVETPIQRRNPNLSFHETHRATWLCREDSYQPLLGIIRRMKAEGKDDSAIAVAARVLPERAAYVRSVWGISA